MSAPLRQTAEASAADMTSEAPRSARQRSAEGSLLDQAPTAIVVTNRAGKIAYWNDEAEALYGWSREEVVGGEQRLHDPPEGPGCESGRGYRL